MPLYVLGRELKDLFPLAFLPNNHALAIAIMSYNGGIDYGLLADYDALPDVDVIAEGIHDSLQELLEAARSRQRAGRRCRGQRQRQRGAPARARGDAGQRCSGLDPPHLVGPAQARPGRGHAGQAQRSTRPARPPSKAKSASPRRPGQPKLARQRATRRHVGEGPGGVELAVTRVVDREQEERVAVAGPTPSNRKRWPLV